MYPLCAVCCLHWLLPEGERIHSLQRTYRGDSTAGGSIFWPYTIEEFFLRNAARRRRFSCRRLAAALYLYCSCTLYLLTALVFCCWVWGLNVCVCCRCAVSEPVCGCGCGYVCVCGCLICVAVEGGAGRGRSPCVPLKINPSSQVKTSLWELSDFRCHLSQPGGGDGMHTLTHLTPPYRRSGGKQ